jgi:outer membrane receptor for ferrienterochelin and colicins
LILSFIWVAALLSAPAQAQETTVTATAAPIEVEAEETTPAAEELVITGSRVKEKLLDTTVTTELINQREILDSGAANLTELLEEQPGVELERLTRGTGVRLMGLDPEHVLILVDGDRVTGRVGGGVDPTRFLLDSVEQVEIVKGAGSAIYGSEAIGGVINIITRRPQKPLELAVSGTYGMFNTVDASGTAGGRLGPVSTLFSGGFHRSDGFTLKKEEGENLQTTGPRFDGWDVSNTTILDLSDDATLRVRGDYSALKQQAEDQFGLTRTSRREQIQSTYSALLSPEIRFGDDGFFKSALSFSHFDFDIEQETGSTRDKLFQTIGQLTVQVDDEVLENHMVSVGLEGILERQGGTHTTEDEGTSDFFEGGTKDRQRAAIFVQDDWTPIDDDFLISVVPSIRVDIDSQFGSVATPRFAIRYDPLEEIALRMSYGLGFRAPTFEELYLDFINPGSNYLVLGNEGLKPERSQAFNLTGTVRPWEWISATGTFYYINLDNLIDTQNVGRSEEGLTEFQYLNVESARSTGVEGTVEFFPIKQLAMSFGYVFNATRDRATDRPLDGRARHKGTVRISFRSDEWGLYAMLRSQIYGTRIFFRDEDGDGITDRNPRRPYATIDFRVEKTLFDWFGLFAGFENLLDEGDPEFTPITPRSFYGGISARYELDEEANP